MIRWRSNRQHLARSRQRQIGIGRAGRIRRLRHALPLMQINGRAAVGGGLVVEPRDRVVIGAERPRRPSADGPQLVARVPNIIGAGDRVFSQVAVVVGERRRRAVPNRDLVEAGNRLIFCCRVYYSIPASMPSTLTPVSLTHHFAF